MSNEKKSNLITMQPAITPTVKELPTLVAWETTNLRNLITHKNEMNALAQAYQMIANNAGQQVADFVNKLLASRGLDVRIYGISSTLDKIIELSDAEKANVAKSLAAQAAAQAPTPSAPPAPAPGTPPAPVPESLAPATS
jgi:hypothetical protein